MSYTYTQEVLTPEAETTFVPAYARKPARTKKVKTWMVLAPVAGLVLIGGAAVMLMNSAGQTEPLAEPAVAPTAVAESALLSSTPTPMATSTPQAPVAVTPPVVTSAPVAPAARPVTRQAEPVVRRAAAAPVPAAEPRVDTPVEVTAPRPYEASPMTAAPRVEAPAAAAPVVVAPAPVPIAPPVPSVPIAPLN